MSEIVKYVLVNVADEYVGHEMDSYQEARNAAEAESEPHAVVQLTYEFSDSELSWAPNGGDVWPPAPAPVWERLGMTEREYFHEDVSGEHRGIAPTTDGKALDTWDADRAAHIESCDEDGDR